ncbi:MAG: cupin domain-containing protein [Melioribacter sp.]|nr:cupin domain-containing protein [Melioribacter sp.]
MDNNFGLTGFIFNDDIQWENVGEGVRRKILAYDKDLMLTAVEFKKGAVGYLHKHPHKQVSYIVSGSFEVTINGEKKIQKAGDVYFIPSNIEHGVLALEDQSLLIDVFTPYREDFIKQQ